VKIRFELNKPGVLEPPAPFQCTGASSETVSNLQFFDCDFHLIGALGTECGLQRVRETLVLMIRKPWRNASWYTAFEPKKAARLVRPAQTAYCEGNPAATSLAWNKLFQAAKSSSLSTNRL